MWGSSTHMAGTGTLSARRADLESRWQADARVLMMLALADQFVPLERGDFQGVDRLVCTLDSSVHSPFTVVEGTEEENLIALP